jgi:hypothetical protein
MFSRLIKRSILICSLSVVVACGAPVHSATDVSDIFSTASNLSLDDKMYNLCDQLDYRKEAPNLEVSGIFFKDCEDPGKYAVDFQTADAFYFRGLDELSDSDEEVVSVRIRSEAWLGKTLIGLAAALGSKFKEKKDMGAGEFDVDGEKGPAADIIDLKTEMVVAPEFDTEDFSFNLEVDIKGEGIVTLDNTIMAAGQLIDDTIAVSIYTKEDRTFEESILKSFKGAVFILPHASDVYVDVYLNIEVHKIGFVDGIIKAQLEQLMGGAMKDILSTTLGL